MRPTKIATPRIVQPGTGPRAWLWVLFIVVLGAWSWQLFDYGRQRAGLDSTQRDRVETRLRDRIAELEADRDRLRSDAARFERSGQIDRAATDGVKDQVRALQEERAALKSEVAFLKGLVSGDGGEKLLLDGPRLTEMAAGAFRFEVSLSKPGEDRKLVVGQVIIEVAGLVDGQEQMLDMETITKGKRSNIGIKFKNFQKLKTEIHLPDGFDPTAIKVSVQPNGRDFQSFHQDYDWKLTDA